MERKGKRLKVVPDGSPRRMADGKNAWRRMSDEQRYVFMVWIVGEAGLGFCDTDLMTGLDLMIKLGGREPGTEEQ